MAAIRPTVTVFDAETGLKDSEIRMPAIFGAPIRMDVVQSIQNGMNRNHRQPYAVSKNAGHQTSAESWGTGRAVSRIPRVPGGGTHRSGQGAFGNMCRGGHMYAPTRVWRKWHRKISVGQRRYAVASALAASAIPPLVMARGHRVDGVPELPLVLENLEAIKKTREAKKILETFKAYADVEKCADSHHIRAGKGKMPNRRHVIRRGPLIVYKETEGVDRAFRNLPGVELCNVERLNLLQLAPGGHLGRFIIWTKSAFERLNALFGTVKCPSEEKKGFRIARAPMTNTDISRIINSDEIQSKLRPTIRVSKQFARKRNPLKNAAEMRKLNPAVDVMRAAAQRSSKKRANVLAAKRT